MEILYKPTFIRELKKLPQALQDEAIEKIAMFEDQKQHAALRVHKLHGPLAGCYSFSVNYAYRVVFQYGPKKQSAILLTIGDHAVYG